MTKIDIISGFLGAGKTTFIKKMLEEVLKGEKVVLIENEFGEVGVDGGFLKDAGIEITEMNSGCICCSLVGDFDKNLREVIARFTPDRILIEPSGVGKLSDVMTSVTKLEGELDVKLNGLVTVVNAAKAVKQMKAFGEFFNNQIEFATTVVLSRTQEIDDTKLEDCVSKLRELNKTAPVITTPWDKLDGAKLLEVYEGQDNLEIKTLAEEAHRHEEEEHEHHHHEHDEEHEHHHEHHHHHEHEEEHEHHHHEHGECCHHHDDDEHEHHHHEHGECCHHHDEECGHGHHHHHADEVFTSFGIETPHKFDKSVIENAMKQFASGDEYGTVIRSKGIVEGLDGTWIYFDFVDGDYELREGSPDYTGRLVVIGADIEEHKLKELFGL